MVKYGEALNEKTTCYRLPDKAERYREMAKAEAEYNRKRAKEAAEREREMMKEEAELQR